MRSLLLGLVLAAAPVAVSAETVIATPRAVIVTAQDHAIVLARRGAFYHSSCGRYEGIGEGSTPDQARRNCCFFGRRQIIDEGVAWSPLRRRWIAVIRYQ